MSLPPDAQRDYERRVGMLLIAAAIEVQTEQKRSMSSTGPPSRPGQYLRFVTGTAREGVVYEPTDPAEAGRLGSIRVGYTAAAWYAGWWEMFGKRLGLRDTVQRIKGRIDKWLSKIRSA